MITSITAKAARVNRGYSQGYCASELGISRSTYIAYENGKAVPTVDMAKRMAKLLGQDLDDIIFAAKI